MIKSFRDLEIYNESFELMILVHKEAIKFPIFEKNDLSSQMRRGSKSIPSNIAEGWAKREHEKEFKKHLGIALGSANEMEVHLETAKALNYLNKDLCNQLIIKYRNLGGKIANLIKRWKT